VVEAFLYLATFIRPGIAFAINIFASLIVPVLHNGIGMRQLHSHLISLQLMKEKLLVINKKKFKLNTKISMMYCSVSDIWNRETIEIDKSFICMIVEKKYIRKKISN